MISNKDLPKTTQGSTVFDLSDGQMAKVERRSDGTFYGQTSKYDFEGSAEEIVAKLNRWNASLAGWE